MASNWDPRPEIWEHIHLLMCGTCWRNLLFHIDHTGNLSQGSTILRFQALTCFKQAECHCSATPATGAGSCRGDLYSPALPCACVEAFGVFAGSAVPSMVSGCFHRTAACPFPQGSPQQSLQSPSYPTPWTGALILAMHLIHRAASANHPQINVELFSVQNHPVCWWMANGANHE